MLAYECDDLPAVEIFPWRFAAGVVAAGKPRDVERNVVAFDFGDHVARQVRRES